MKKKGLVGLISTLLLASVTAVASVGVAVTNHKNAGDNNGNENQSYTITFETNGGDMIKSELVGVGGYLTGPTVTREGYEFLGWYTDVQCTKPFDFYATPISGNITLYAKWSLHVDELYEFSLYGDEAYMITSYKQKDNTDITKLVLPSSYHGLPVTRIDSNVFENCTGLTTIIIPNSVTSTGEYIFANCPGLNIYIENESVPGGWHMYWDKYSSGTRVLFYGMDWEYDADGNPVEINK